MRLTRRHWIWASALALGLAHLVLLLVTAPEIGYARDEGFYFQAARVYGKWLALLASDPSRTLQRTAIEATFRVNAEHPPLMKFAFALSHHFLHQVTHWIATPGQSFRFPAMVLAALGTVLVARWGARTISIGGGLVAGAFFVFLPRVFFHSHLACFDVPAAVFGLMTALTWDHALRTGRLKDAVWVGLAFGAMLLTKHNAWLIPPVLILHFSCVRGRALWRASWTRRLKILAPVMSLLTLGPLVLVLGWPWLWFDTWAHLTGWARFHLHHVYYNMEFLGQTYWKPPMPRAYPWVMTLATVPMVTIVSSLLGMAAVLGAAGPRLFSTVARRFGARAASSMTAALDGQGDTYLLWLLMIVGAYLPWLSSDTPIFGGTKHWLGAYPFMCLFAGRGYRSLVGLWSKGLPRRLAGSSRGKAAALASATLALLAAPAVTTLGSTPWGLSSYMPVVGGAPGAATLGLNRTFWGYTTPALFGALREASAGPARIFVHDTALQSWAMYQQDGTLPKRYTGTLSITNSDEALYHYEPHMGRVEYQIWQAYGTTTPKSVATYHGVPVLWLYVRPERRR